MPTAHRRLGALILSVATTLGAPLAAQDELAPFEPLIRRGAFSEARAGMRRLLAERPAMAPLERRRLAFEIERLERIRLDFRARQGDVLAALGEVLPGVTSADLERWERAGTLECMVIDGEKRYFNRAAANLLLLDPRARAAARRGRGEASHPTRAERAARIIATTQALGTALGPPQHLRLSYTLSVHADALPAGEIVRAWLPYPRAGHPRQSAIELLGTTPARHLIAPNDENLQRSIYFEQPARAGRPTVFRCTFEYLARARYQRIDPTRVLPYRTSSQLYRRHTAARPPHITFHPEFREVLSKVLGDESNPYLRARKIFRWVDQWTPWAGAREYSTLRDIPMYCYRNRHGDCGMQTLFFMTLARMSGIPARWQSGWWVDPEGPDLHDWCEIYLEPYGWVPVDQSFGLLEDADEAVRWFYLGGIDPWRWIINDDFSRPLYPAKIHPRSETVDFQRGEVEWRGGNLYFDRWDYHLDVELLE